MKALRLEGPGNIVLREIPVPKISDDEVLLEVKYCGICGSDLHMFYVPGTFTGTYMGHEFSGVIAQVGSKVEGWQPGDRVAAKPTYQCGKCWACRHGFLPSCERQPAEAISGSTDENFPGAFTKFVRVPIPNKRLFRLPEEVSFEEGALVEPLACSLHAIRMSTFKPEDQAMVLGAGPIGLGVIAFLKSAGAGLIVVTEVDGKRAEVAKKLGADYIFNPMKISNLREEVLKLTNGLGVSQVFECSGMPQAFQSTSDFLRPRGEVILVGVIPPSDSGIS